jgi:hypothetical protein
MQEHRWLDELPMVLFQMKKRAIVRNGQNSKRRAEYWNGHMSMPTHPMNRASTRAFQRFEHPIARIYNYTIDDLTFD